MAPSRLSSGLSIGSARHYAQPHPALCRPHSIPVFPAAAWLQRLHPVPEMTPGTNLCERQLLSEDTWPQKEP